MQRMHVSESFEELVHVQSDQLRIQSILRLLQHFQQVILHVLKDQIDDSLLPEGLLKFHDVGVFEHLEHLHLPHRGLLNDLVLLSLLEFLYRHYFTGLVAAAF